MRVVSLAFLALTLGEVARAAACCAGGNPKSFITLQRLQTFEVGLSSTFRDVYGEYDLYGDLEDSGRNQTLSLLFGAGARLTTDLQASLTLPLVHQENKFGRDANTRSGLGDIILGAQYTLLESLFQDEWYPTVTLAAGIKTPTGKIETNLGGVRTPGTGNGTWEPFLGVGLQKTYGPAILAFRASYSARLAKDALDKGDAVELIESVSYLFSQPFSIAAGLTQTWTLDDRISGQTKADSATRVASAFIAPTYFLTRYWSIGGGVDFALPLDRAGVNQQAGRSVTLTTKYGFY